MTIFFRQNQDLKRKIIHIKVGWVQTNGKTKNDTKQMCHKSCGLIDGKLQINKIKVYEFLLQII